MKNLLLFIFILFITQNLSSQCNADFFLFESDTVAFFQIFPQDRSTGDIISRKWTYYDSSLNKISLENNKFTEKGNYKICLEIFGDDCYDSICKDIKISYPCPNPDYLFNYLVLDDSVSFYYFGSTPENYIWSFGDGTFSNEMSPGHIYEDTGVYEACLVRKSLDNQCPDTICYNVHVGQPSFRTSYEYEINGHGVKFRNTTSKDSGTPYIVSTNWIFGDGTEYKSTTNEDSVFHYFPNSGKYEVCMKIKISWPYRAGDPNFFKYLYPFCDTLTIESSECFAYFEIENINKWEKLISFKNLSTFAGDENSTQWLWNYGEGLNDTIFEPEMHQYENIDYVNEQKNVCLTLKESSGCEDKYCEIVDFYIFNIPVLKNQEFELFPLPFQNELNIKINIPDENVTLKIFNLNSQLIKILYIPKDDQDINCIDLSNLKDGVYFLLFENSKSRYYRKVIKMN